MIRKATKKDLHILADLASLLWLGHTLSDITQELCSLLARKSACFFIKFENETPVGFAQCQLRRDYVEGAKSTPTGYLEGIFIKKDYRNRGYGRDLLYACEQWAKKNNCKEFASDCEIGNRESSNFHKALGFSEANRIICFIKKL